MQYWKPADGLSVGDAMPFTWGDTYHLVYLVDEGHHSKFHGLGGHIWAHASTKDLVHWEPHPLAVPLGEPGTYDQYGICTGSVFEHEGTFTAFYATRTLDSGALTDPDRKVTERVCVSTSQDAIHFTKSPENPILSPPRGYRPRDWRDPFVFREEATGEFHMLISACLEPAPIADRGGCLAHYVSPDLKCWEHREPFLVPGLVGVPECPDYFFWNGWYYLTFLIGGWARYRMSREPFGPWLCPPVDTYDGPGVNAMKTAAFGPERRIGAGFLAWNRDSRDDGPRQYAGNLVFREILQHRDGTLGSRFPAEMVPAAGPAMMPAFQALNPGVECGEPGAVRLSRHDGLAVACCDGVPVDARVTLRVMPHAAPAHFGVCVRGAGDYESGYELRLSPRERRARLSRLGMGANAVEDAGFTGLGEPLTLELVLHDDIVDVCIAGRRCLIRRCPELKGEQLFLFCENGDVSFEGIEVRPGG